MPSLRRSFATNETVVYYIDDTWRMELLDANDCLPKMLKAINKSF